MLRQVSLIVLTAVVACHSYPVTNNKAYRRSPQQLLLPQPLPLPARPFLPADASPLQIQRLTQAQLPLPVPASGQYLFYYPGVPGSAPVVYAVRNNATEGQEEGGGALNAIYNFFTGFWETSSAKPVEEANPQEPSKVSEGQGSVAAPASANLESFDEDETTEPTSPSPADPKKPEHKLFLIGQPQFFGNYDALKNPQVIKELGNSNPFPNILLNNQQPFVWQGEFPPPGFGTPGKAATEFQKILEAAKFKKGGESGSESDGSLTRRAVAASKKPAIDSDSVVVEALKVLPNAASSSEEEDDGVEAVEQAEPSVAQVRPQAIALAGPSGVAAAAPVGTAVVGRGGLAVAAPAATAVAGPSGGEPPLIVPANRIAHQAFLAAHGQSRFLDRADDEQDDYNDTA